LSVNKAIPDLSGGQTRADAGERGPDISLKFRIQASHLVTKDAMTFLARSEDFPSFCRVSLFPLKRLRDCITGDLYRARQPVFELLPTSGQERQGDQPG
jgi:hypothetical protein